jgi:hypothetical protein
MRAAATILALVLALCYGVTCGLAASRAEGSAPSASEPEQRRFLRYEAPDGSLAFTDDPRRVPAGVRPEAVAEVAPSDARWTRVDRVAAPHLWWAPREGYESRQAGRFWTGRAEAARREIEDADALQALADEIGYGRGAAALHGAHARARAERLEDACRASGDCLPGHLRAP